MAFHLFSLAVYTASSTLNLHTAHHLHFAHILENEYRHLASWSELIIIWSEIVVAHPAISYTALASSSSTECL